MRANNCQSCKAPKDYCRKCNRFDHFMTEFPVVVTEESREDELRRLIIEQTIDANLDVRGLAGIEDEEVFEAIIVERMDNRHLRHELDRMGGYDPTDALAELIDLTNNYYEEE